MNAHASRLSFLLAAWEGGGSVAPFLTVARKLIERGHDVRVMSDRCNRPETEACGAAFVPWTRAPSRSDRSRDSDIFRDWELDSPQEQIRRVLERVWTGPALAYAEDLVEELRRKPVDLVVASEMLFGTHVGCEAIGQKHVLLTCNIHLFPIPGIPPIGPGLLPAASAEEEALHADIADASEQLLDGAGVPSVNAARAHFGLQPIATLPDQHKSAEALLLGTARAFDFAPKRLPGHIRYVGPQLDDPAWAPVWRSPWPADDSRPLVLVAFSTTFQNHTGVLQKIIDAASALPVRVVVTLGDTIACEELSAPDNCQLVHSAPHNQVMRHSALVATHGGHGTVIRALRHLKPLLVVPHGRDQNDNAARVTSRGAGLALPAYSTAEAFAGAIGELLADGSYAAAAQTLGRQIRAEADHSPIIEELEQLAGGGASLRAA